jgi:cob(I)alamin adenosyltransferase
VAHDTAADDVLTRELEALRAALVDAGHDLARERGQHEIHQRDLTRLRATMRDFDDAQRELHARLNPPPGA